MPAKSRTCPMCGLDDRTAKVNQVYIEALSKSRNEESAKTAVFDRIFADTPIGQSSGMLLSQRLSILIRGLQPPSGEARVTRLISPDLFFAFYFIMAVFILYQIYATQHGVFLPTVGVFVLSVVAYVLLRKKIMGRYQASLKAQEDARKRVEEGIGRWMKLYYCARDNGVFDPQKDVFIPLEEMRAYLYQAAGKPAAKPATPPDA